LPAGFESLGDQADKGKGRTERIAQRCVAAARMPSIETLGRQSQRRDLVLASHECEACGRDLHDIGSAARVEQVGTAELMRKGLAVIAIADDAIDGFWRGVPHHRSHLAAATAQFSLDVHVSVPFGVAPMAQLRSCSKRVGMSLLPARWMPVRPTAWVGSDGVA